jgi:hypothetical protein
MNFIFSVVLFAPPKNMKNTLIKSNLLFAFLNLKDKFLVFILVIWLAHPASAQKSNWYLFQPNNQGVNVAFTNNGCSQGSNYFKPLKPYSNQSFTNYLSVNSQTDARGKILFYVLSTMDSVYLYNSNNVCVKVFSGYDLSPTIIPLPGGIRYHLIVGTQLYWFGLRDLTIVNNDVFDFQNATANGLVKINVSAQDPKYVAKRAVKILKYSCDTFIYRLYSIEANYAGKTGRYVVSRDIVTIGGLVIIKINDPAKRLDEINNSLHDINLDYTISQMELSPNQNELIFSGGSCLLRVDVSGSQFGSATRTCFNSNTITNDSNRFFCGIEYITDTLVLLSLFQTHDSTSVNQGLYLYNKVNNSFTKVANSIDFKYSYIERGKDGKIYVSKSDGLYKYDKNSNTVSRVIQLSLVPSVPFLKLIFNELDKPEIRVFYLPNAINSYNNEILKDFQSVMGSIEIKSPPLPEKQLYTNAGHNLTPKGSGEILILDSLIITNIADWVVFDSMTIQFAEGSFLRIMGGSDLELKGTTLMGACGDMWNGIEIVQNSSMDSRLICRKNTQGRRTVIRDALVGVQTRSSNHGIKTNDSTLFIANKVGMNINNAYPSMYNITNTFFIDSLILNNGEKAQSAISAEKASLKIGNKDSLPVVIIGGKLGVVGETCKSVEIQNLKSAKIENEAIVLQNIDNIKIYNTQTNYCNYTNRGMAAVLINGYGKFDFKQNKIAHNSSSSALKIIARIGGHATIGGLVSDSNRIVFNNDGTGIEFVGVSNNFFANSQNRPLEVLGRPILPLLTQKQVLKIENNSIISHGNSYSKGYGIDVKFSINSKGNVKFDTLCINNNKLVVQNGILLQNISAVEPNKMLPMLDDWLKGSNKRHISFNQVKLIQHNPYVESVGIVLYNTDHLYCVGNKIINSGSPGISSSSNFSIGAKLVGASNTLVYLDSFVGLYCGVDISGSNYFSNVYCNWFFYNFNSIKLTNPTLRLKYSALPFYSFNQMVHGSKLLGNFTARSNTFIGYRFNGSIFNNDKLSQADYCKWILESSTLSIPFFVSNPKKRDFIFNLPGINNCGENSNNANALDNKAAITSKDYIDNPIQLFWDGYFNCKYNIVHAKSNTMSTFQSDLIALEFALDSGTLTQVESAINNLLPTDSLQTEIKKVFVYWFEYISQYDTSFYGENELKSFKIWDSDSIWHAHSQTVDTMRFYLNYKPLPKLSIGWLDSIARFSPFGSKPASYFARNLLGFMVAANGYVDSFIQDLVPITGRVTGSCFGGGVQGITVKLFDEYHNNTGIFAISEAAGYFRFSGDELKNLDTNRKYYVRVFLPSDSNHISATAKLWNLQNDSLLNVDCVFPGVQPLSILNREDIEIRIDPNPAKDLIVISGLKQGYNYKLSIFNSLGTLVVNSVIENDTNQKVRFDTSGLLDGIYYLRLESNGKLCSIKVIIQH